MTEVHRYKVVKMLSEGGNRISYDPHGPEVVMAEAYDQLKADNEVLRKDAERYRWIEKQPNSWFALGEAFDLPSEHEGMPGLNASIDAAMAKEASHD